MSDPATVRERIEYASQYFKQIHGVVLTTFSLNGEFLANNVLPSIFNIEGEGAGRKAELHNRLSHTPVTVFYDPTIAPGLSGHYRFVAQPVPLPGRFFHPKLVMIAGVSEEGTTWVYLAVSSANLTLSGWGRNAESFGETWIHTHRQQPWKALRELLGWLDSYCNLKEKQGAVAEIRKTLDSMPNRRRFNTDPKRNEPWSGSLNASLYLSVSQENTQGLAGFLREERSRASEQLWVYSPYWSDVANQIEKFNAKETVLVPALSSDGKTLGLSSEQFAELNDTTTVCRNEKDGDRFWHMKAYWLSSGYRTRTAVGSCNFTSAGLVGGDIGNVEAMLVFDDEDWSWLPPEDTEKSLNCDDFSVTSRLKKVFQNQCQ